VDASPMAVAEFMNPLHFIGNDVTVLMFEELGWGNLDYNTAVAGVKTMLTGTFMSEVPNNGYNNNYVDADGHINYVNTSGTKTATGVTYAEAICTAAQTYKINPYYLTSKIIGEVGSDGKSGSVTGTNSSYTGYYNFLNVGATDSSTGDAVAKGLAYAKSQSWNSPMASISGGAAFLSNGYISAGQSTPYLQKFNVKVGSINTSHQYMTAVNGVHYTLQKTYDGYKSNSTLENVRTFTIPIYNNMPDGTGTSIQFPDYTKAATVTSNSPTVRTAPNYSASETSLGTKSITLTAGVHNNGNVATTGTMYYGPLWYQVGSKYIIEDYVQVSAVATVNKGSSITLRTSQNSGSTEKPRFMSWDTRIATVDSNGKVTGVSAGTTKVVAYLSCGAFAVVDVKVTSTNANGVPTSASSGTYSINDAASYISKVSSGTTVGQLLAGINERNYISITKNDAALSSDAVVSTGCIVSIKDGSSVVKSYTVVVTGDVGENNGIGDGSIDIADLIAIRNEILASLNNKSTLSGANLKAADIDGNGSIEIDDLIKVRDQILGRSNISPIAY